MYTDTYKETCSTYPLKTEKSMGRRADDPTDGRATQRFTPGDLPAAQLPEPRIQGEFMVIPSGKRLQFATWKPWENGKTVTIYPSTNGDFP